jgi:hypothetical protein
MCDRLHRQACEEEGIDPEADMTIFFNPANVAGKKFRAVFNDEKYQKARRLAKR